MIWIQIYCRVGILPRVLFSTENNGKHQKFVLLAAVVTRIVLFIREKESKPSIFGLSKLKHLVPSFLRLSISAVLLVFTHRLPHVRTWEDMKLSAVLTGTSLQIYNAHMHEAMSDHSNCSVSKYNIVSVEWRLILPIQCQKLHAYLKIYQSKLKG